MNNFFAKVSRYFASAIQWTAASSKSTKGGRYPSDSARPAFKNWQQATFGGGASGRRANRDRVPCSVTGTLHSATPQAPARLTLVRLQTPEVRAMELRIRKLVEQLPAVLQRPFLAHLEWLLHHPDSIKQATGLRDLHHGVVAAVIGH